VNVVRGHGSFSYSVKIGFVILCNNAVLEPDEEVPRSRFDVYEQTLCRKLVKCMNDGAN